MITILTTWQCSPDTAIASICRVAPKGRLRLVAARAQVIDELEPVLPMWLVKQHPDWFPPYIFVLKASWCRTALLCSNAKLYALLCIPFKVASPGC